MRTLVNVVTTSIKRNIRSKSFIFWTIVFPIIMMTLFGSIYGQQVEVKINLGIVDNDGSSLSQNFIEMLRNTSFSVKVFSNEEELNYTISHASAQFMGKISLGLIIPEDFSEQILNFSQPPELNVTILRDKTSITDTYVLIIESILAKFVSGVRGNYTIAIRVVDVFRQSITSVDIIMNGFTIMVTAYTSGFVVTLDLSYEKERKIFRRVLLSPFSPYQFLMGKIISGIIVSFIGIATFWTYAVLVFKVHLFINLFVILEILCAIIITESISLLLTSFIKKREVEESAINLIIMMMMFLSGVYIPLDILPPAMKNIAYLFPFSWCVMALRESLLLGTVITWTYVYVILIMTCSFAILALVVFKLRLRRISE